MKQHSKRSPIIFIFISLVSITFLTASLADVRRAAGGGRSSTKVIRTGPAAGGSVSRHHHRKRKYERRDDIRDDIRRDRRRWRIGTTLTATAFRSLSCQPQIIVVGNVTYYRCSSGWYRRAYSGGSVTYIVVNAPAGY